MVQTTGSIALITERVLAGLAAAKKRGRVGGVVSENGKNRTLSVD